MALSLSNDSKGFLALKHSIIGINPHDPNCLVILSCKDGYGISSCEELEGHKNFFLVSLLSEDNLEYLSVISSHNIEGNPDASMEEQAKLSKLQKALKERRASSYSFGPANPINKENPGYMEKANKMQGNSEFKSEELEKSVSNRRTRKPSRKTKEPKVVVETTPVKNDSEQDDCELYPECNCEEGCELNEEDGRDPDTAGASSDSLEQNEESEKSELI